MTPARPPSLPGRTFPDGGDPGTNEALALGGTGPYWEVASVAGHFKCSGWAQTPAPGSLHLAGGRDTAYMLLGCRNLRTGKCCDAGIFLTPAGQVWDMAVFPNDPAKPGHGWLDRPIHRPARGRPSTWSWRPCGTPCASRSSTRPRGSPSGRWSRPSTPRGA